jgi:hypothetical protein
VLFVQGTCNFEGGGGNCASHSTSYSHTKDEYLWEIAATSKCCASNKSRKFLRHLSLIILIHQVGNDPCGFCRHSNMCSISLTKLQWALVLVSGCPYFFKFSLVSTEKSTSSGLSTNQPLWCDICHTCQHSNSSQTCFNDEHVFWSYKASNHFPEYGQIMCTYSYFFGLIYGVQYKCFDCHAI